MRPSALSSGGTLLVARLSAAAVVCLSFSRTLWLPNDLQKRKTIRHQRISTSAKPTTALRPVQTRIQAFPACEYASSSLEAVVHVLGSQNLYHVGREMEEAPFLLFLPIRSSTCWKTSAMGNYRKLNASAVGAGTGETSVVSQDEEEKLRENLPFPVEFSNLFHVIVMIREALIGDNYLSSTLVVEKVKKVCQLQETMHTFFL